MSNRQENDPDPGQIYSLVRQYDEALAQGASTAPIEADSSRLKQRNPKRSINFSSVSRCWKNFTGKGTTEILHRWVT